VTGRAHAGRGSLVRLLLIVALGAAPLLWLSVHGLSSFRDALAPRAQAIQSARQAPPRASGRAPARVAGGGGSAPARAATRAPGTARRIADATERALAWLGILIGALGAPVLALRLRARRRRRVVRYRIAFPRAEGAAPERVAGLLEAWHRTLQRERGFTRLVFGQPHLALEWHSLPDPASPQAAPAISLCVVCPPELVAELDRGLAACYPNARLGYEFTPPPAPWEVAVTWSARMVRLVKGRPFLLRAGAIARRGEAGLSVVEAAMAVAGARAVRVGVQIRLAPAPRLVERWARRRLSTTERNVEAARRRELGPGPGLSAPSVRRELEGGLELLHRGLYWSEVWVIADDEQAVRAVAGTLQASGGENPLARRRAWIPLHRKRVARALPGVLSPSLMGAAELACLWHLPAPAAGALVARRNHLPRLPAAPDVPRPLTSERGLVEDERGPVTLPAHARLLGIAVDGLSGTGKTETLAAVARLAAADPGTWLCVLDPKSDLVERALSVIPQERRVRVLNFAEPLFGINPLEADADPEAIAEAVIGALRDVHEEGDIRASSDRYLRLAITGAIAYARSAGIRPTLWLVKDLLDPSAGEELRRRVVRVAQRDPALAHVATFFDRTLPDQLQNARTMTTTKLDAPANKLYRFLGQLPDRVLHHPAQLAIDDLVRQREILVVDGAMGRVGEDTSRKLMQILMRLIYAALQRQQELPAAERVRMCVVFDEAHFILNPTIAKAAAVGRSGLLELAAGFQQLAQFQDPVVRAMVEDLLQHQMTFRAAAEDARQAASQAMQSYADVIRDDPESRALQRVAPDMLTNLPDHHCLCSWVVAGTRQPAFLGRTLRVAIDRERIARHLAASRARPVRDGVAPHFPPELPNAAVAMDDGLDRQVPETVRPSIGGLDDQRRVPARFQTRTPAPPGHRRPRRARQAAVPREDAAPPDVAAPPPHDGPSGEPPPNGAPLPADEDQHGAPAAAPQTPVDGPAHPPEVAADAGAGESAETPADPPAAQERPPDDSPDADEEPEPPDAADADVDCEADVEPEGGPPPLGAPPSYVEVQVDGPIGLVWDRKTAPVPTARLPRAPEFQVLQLLYKAGFLLGSQIMREVGWRSARTAQHALTAMVAQGWLRRFSFRTERGGREQFVYILAAPGYAVAREQMRLFDDHAPSEESWREPDVADPRRVLHDLHVAGWILALGRVLPKSAVNGWHGPRARLARPEPALRGRGGERRVISVREVPVGPDRAIADLQLERFAPIRSDGMVELALRPPEGPRRLDLFVELDRTRKPARNMPKFAAYDAFITAWSAATPRYQSLSDRPLVVFVCDDEPQARAFCRAADASFTGRIITLRTPPDQWRYPGRERAYFCCERDVHEGSLRAWRLPPLPPDVRAELGLEREPHPQGVELVSTGRGRPASAGQG